MTVPFLAVGPGSSTVAFLSVGPSITSGSSDIVVEAPLADVRLLVGETVDIHVSVTPFVSGSFDVLLSLDGGSTFPITLLTDEAEIDLSWTITAAHISATAVLRVRDSADAMLYGDSDEFVVATTSPGSGDNTEVLAEIAELQAAVAALATGQNDIDTAISSLQTGILGLTANANPLVSGYVSAITEPLIIGDDYISTVGRLIRLNLLDRNGDPASTTYGTKTLADAGISIQLLLKPSGDKTGLAQLVGSCTFVPAPDVDSPASLDISLPRSQTALAVPGSYDLQVEAKWTDGETVTFLPFGKFRFVKDIQRPS